MTVDHDNPLAPAAPGADARPLRDVVYVVDAVFRLQQAIAKIGAMRLRPWKMSLSGYAAMKVLERQPRLSLAQLSRRCFVKPQTMIRIVAELERRGYVLRGPNEESERAISLILTPEGAATLTDMAREVDKIESTIQHAVSDEDVLQLNATLRSCAILVEGEIKDMEKKARTNGTQPRS